MSFHTPCVWTDKAWAGRQWWMESSKNHSGQGKNKMIWRVWRVWPFCRCPFVHQWQSMQKHQLHPIEPVLNQSCWEGRKFHYLLQFNWHFKVLKILNSHILCIWTAEALLSIISGDVWVNINSRIVLILTMPLAKRIIVGNCKQCCQVCNLEHI